MVERQPCKLKVLGSIPSGGSICFSGSVFTAPPLMGGDKIEEKTRGLHVQCLGPVDRFGFNRTQIIPRDPDIARGMI